MPRETEGALELGVAVFACLSPLAIESLVVTRKRFLSQLFRVGRFRGGQRACWRSTLTAQTIDESAPPFHPWRIDRSRVRGLLACCLTATSRRDGEEPAAAIEGLEPLRRLDQFKLYRVQDAGLRERSNFRSTHLAYQDADDSTPNRRSSSAPERFRGHWARRFRLRRRCRISAPKSSCGCRLTLPCRNGGFVERVETCDRRLSGP
jgi:hypothetical protein